MTPPIQSVYEAKSRVLRMLCAEPREDDYEARVRHCLIIGAIYAYIWASAGGVRWQWLKNSARVESPIWEADRIVRERGLMRDDFHAEIYFYQSTVPSEHQINPDILNIELVHRA